MTDIRGRMTTKGPEAPAMLGHPDIMVFVLVVFWCVTLCDFVTCYSGYKNSCKYCACGGGNKLLNAWDWPGRAGAGGPKQGEGGKGEFTSTTIV